MFAESPVLFSRFNRIENRPEYGMGNRPVCAPDIPVWFPYAGPPFVIRKLFAPGFPPYLAPNASFAFGLDAVGEQNLVLARV